MAGRECFLPDLKFVFIEMAMWPRSGLSQFKEKTAERRDSKTQNLSKLLNGDTKCRNKLRPVTSSGVKLRIP